MEMVDMTYQGAHEAEGDCPAQWGDSNSNSWMCTLKAGHAGLHEAWGLRDDLPRSVYGVA